MRILLTFEPLLLAISQGRLPPAEADSVSLQSVMEVIGHDRLAPPPVDHLLRNLFYFRFSAPGVRSNARNLVR